MSKRIIEIVVHELGKPARYEYWGKVGERWRNLRPHGNRFPIEREIQE